MIDSTFNGIYLGLSPFSHFGPNVRSSVFDLCQFELPEQGFHQTLHLNELCCTDSYNYESKIRSTENYYFVYVVTAYTDFHLVSLC